MEFNDYYRNELSTLRTEGSEFARKNPALSTFLAKPGQDPDVERLLEGFAFLTGRLKQQIDKELPEVAHTLVQLLWPNYVRPTPSYCIIKYDAITDSNDNFIVEKNTSILSKTIESTGIKCQFTTSYETELMPYILKDVEYYPNGQQSSLNLYLEVASNGTLFDTSIDKLRVYLGGSKFVAKDIYLLLNQYVESINLSVLDENDKELKTIRLPKNSVEPVGFKHLEKLCPYPLNVFNGYILLQEYFAYPEKFSFLDITNLDMIKNIEEEVLQKSKKVLINFELKKRIKTNEIPNTDNFLLYCTPAINIFETDSVPIRKGATSDEYLVRPSDLPKEQSEVFAINSVRGWVSKKNAYAQYTLFESFDHNDDSEYYSTRVKLSDSKEDTKTYLRFASKDGLYEDENNSNAIVSVNILCTNKNAANDNLLLGDINMPDPLSSSSNYTFENITIPTPSYIPPIDGDFLWKIISNMSLNFLSLDNVNVLSTVIESYDFIGASDISQKNKTSVMLSGMKNISYKSVEMMDRGLPIRGIEVIIDMNPSKFDSLGDVYIFSSILNEFLSLYGNINSFHKLTVHVDNEDTFNWKYKMGSRSLI